MEKLKEILNGYNKPSILDIATGVGSFISIITQLTENYSKIIGIDNNPRAIEAAGKNFENPKVSFLLMDAADMKFDKHSFDIVCLSNSMHHMKDINSVINKMAEVVKPNGILLFNEMISDNEDEQRMTHTYFHHFWAEVNRANGIVHDETMTKQEILNVFTNHKGICLKTAWEMQVPDEGDLPDEAYAQLRATLDRSLDAVKDKSNFAYYKETADKLRERLETIGFKSAVQILAVTGIPQQ